MNFNNFYLFANLFRPKESEVTLRSSSQLPLVEPLIVKAPR